MCARRAQFAPSRCLCCRSSLRRQILMAWPDQNSSAPKRSSRGGRSPDPKQRCASSSPTNSTKSLVTPPFERESSRTAVRMAKELAGACYLTPTTRQASRATMRKPRPTSVVAVSNRRAKGSGDTAMPCSLSWSTKSRAALIGITDGPAKPNFP
jgi:hypothetical protein